MIRELFIRKEILLKLKIYFFFKNGENFWKFGIN